MECVLLRATITATHCIVSRHIRLSAYLHCRIAAAGLVDLVWPPRMDEPVHNAYARARYAAQLVRSHSANRCLDQCALLDIPGIGHTPDHRLPDSPQQPAGFSLPRLDPAKKPLHSPWLRHLPASRRILPDLRSRPGVPFSKSSHSQMAEGGRLPHASP